MTILKDGAGFKRIIGLVLAAFGMTMIVVRVAQKALTINELVVWLGFITVDALGTGGLTVAEKRREQPGGNPTQGITG